MYFSVNVRRDVWRVVCTATLAVHLQYLDERFTPIKCISSLSSAFTPPHHDSTFMLSYDAGDFSYWKVLVDQNVWQSLSS